MEHSILLICKKIILLFLVVIIFGACASHRYGPKPPKKKRCDCPHFTQELFIYDFDNYTIETEKTNG
ncbi:MAG: hypothetical protein LBE13_23225 [Bacteroidales bacterium]|jgi:hypothetical protein|nr:hypothetical protein [Bacteroidales bacterium]